ncbi:MAG: hypothetical protein E6R04_04635 [Spirochaetes bacterium]|nr:MAG: hypothetical protein E6R04_04635 [Spirochaetota bacterium]
MNTARLASYVVGPDRIYFVTTIDYRNPSAPSFDCHESGIRDMTRHKEGHVYMSYAENKAAIPFTLCQHNICPLERGHKEVIQALKDGICPEEVWDYLKREPKP